MIARVAGILFVLIFTAGSRLFAAELFPFVLPWDDATPGATNVSGWLDAPAGRDGFVTVQDGHLFAGKKRLRLFGVNLAFGANFPTHEAAEKVAARMAKFGINCVRFHHMDMQAAPSGIWAKDLATLDPERLDRLDYFIAQLKAHGIYADLNLHVSRTYPDIPRAEKPTNPSFDAGVDNFSARLIELQKDYARALLSHVNPYTKSAYTQEPAVALIEINNENALLAQWNWGGLDKMAAPYRAELGALWTQWLRGTYRDDAALAAAWAAGAHAAGPELLRQGGFTGPSTAWYLEEHEGARAEASIKDGAMRIEVRQPGKEPWHVQLGQGGLRFREGESYTVTVRARADSPCKISVNASQAHAPWTVFGSKELALTPEWQTFTFAFIGKTDDNARVTFSSLGKATGGYEFADASLHTSAIDGEVRRDASGAIETLTKDGIAGHSPAAQRDWFRFLWSLEEKYWPGMYDFIRGELKAKPLIVGTQLGWSPFPIQARMDVIDSHSYWQHPHFPGRSWDMDNWTVKNDAMTGAADGGTLSRLALQRVAGKPYICTEYNHAAPNTFSSETFPLLCAYAALQDWDGVFAFAYCHRGDDWEKGYFPSFFDIDQHPTKMATLPASLALFMRGDVQRGAQELVATISVDSAMDTAQRGGPRIGAEQFGLDYDAALLSRVGVRLGDRDARASAAITDRKRVVSDTRELVWDKTDRVVTVDTARSKAVIGFAERRSYDLGGVQIEFGALRQGFGVLQVTVLDGADFATARRVLITATADLENTGMKWTSDKKDSVGRNWGHAPSLVEGVPVKITLPHAGKLKAWVLDERGQRGAELPVRAGVLEIGPEHKTLWYEVAAE